LFPFESCAQSVSFYTCSEPIVGLTPKSIKIEETSNKALITCTKTLFKFNNSLVLVSDFKNNTQIPDTCATTIKTRRDSQEIKTSKFISIQNFSLQIRNSTSARKVCIHPSTIGY